MNRPLTFYIQAGLARESVSFEGGELTMPTIREIACAFVDKKFPTHGLSSLSSKLMLFWYDADEGGNVLQRLTDASNVSEGTLLEVVVAADSACGTEEDVRPHSLMVHSYRSPHFCDFCGEMLWGLVRQGLKCEGCGLNFHKRCAYKIPNDCSLCRRKVSATSSDMTATETQAWPNCSPRPLFVSMSVPMIPPESRSNRSRSVPSSGRSIWLEKQFVSLIKVPHTFVVHNFTRPTVCMFCRKLLKGLFRQGYQCTDCQYNAHKKCTSQVAKDCKGGGRWTSVLPSMCRDSVEGPDTPGDSSDAEDEASSIEQEEEEEAKPRLSPSSSVNIPLQRVVQSVKHTKRAGGNCIRKGWMVHFTDKYETRKRHFWVLDTKCLTLFHEEHSSRYFKEIKLSDMIVVELNKPSSENGLMASRPDFVFTIRTTGLVYFVGQDLDASEPPPSSDTGQGRELAMCWEHAIHQALMPVTAAQADSEEKTIDHKVSAPKSGNEREREDISKIYQLFADDILGSGMFGIVYGAKHRKTGREVAIKVIDKLRFPTKQEAQLKNEVSILHTLHHPAVVNLEKMFETPERIYVVMEKLKGDMLEMILSSPRGRLTERVTKYLISQILLALKHLHSRSIVHCDLKPENVLLSSETPFPQVKLCDFGFARIIGEKSFRKSVVGTPAYLAPEVVKNKGYNRSLDMWSVGVIIYVSLSGTFPFNEDEEILDQIQNAAFMYPANPWCQISEAAPDLINNLLQVKLRKRYTCDKSLAHVWLQDYQCWCDLRKQESIVGERYLTHESDDIRWESYRREKKLAYWTVLGHAGASESDQFTFQKRDRPK